MLSKRLNEVETRKVLNKIKKKFEDYSAIYGEPVFSYEAFRGRYLDYLRSGGRLEVFLFAEIQALEDRKKELDEKKAKRQRVREAQEVLEKKGEELNKRIAAYPEENLPSRARYEIKKLVGVLKIIYEPLNKYVYDAPSPTQDIYRDCLGTLRAVTLKPYSGLFKRYYDDLNNPMVSPSKLELQEQSLLREWGSIINTFIKIFQRISNNSEISEMLNILEKISLDFRLNIFKPNL